MAIFVSILIVHTVRVVRYTSQLRSNNCPVFILVALFVMICLLLWHNGTCFGKNLKLLKWDLNIYFYHKLHLVCSLFCVRLCIVSAFWQCCTLVIVYNKIKATPLYVFDVNMNVIHSNFRFCLSSFDNLNTDRCVVVQELHNWTGLDDIEF